jgi:hypothetical protein
MPADRAAPSTPRRTLARWRVAVLVLVLGVVLAWAASVRLRRDHRRQWTRPLDVGVLVLAPGGVPRAKIDALEQGLPRLERFLDRESARYRESPSNPVRLTLLGAAGVDEAWPVPPEGGGLLARALHAWRLRRWLAAAHRSAGVPAGGFDARLYLLLEPAPPGRAHRVEGVGAAGGEVGLVTAELDGATLDLALTALAHELLHCLGATDKYDADGHALEPDGLVEPDRAPRYPQPAAELMAGEVPTAPGAGRVPDTLDEVRIGAQTAAEIGWISNISAR